MSLAHAIVEYIHDHVGAKTLFSTHYHELTRLEETLPRVVNVHARCVEKDGKVVFLHRIEPGRADRSYGIQVAELAGMPQEVIRRAKVILDELEGQAETAAAVQQLELFPSVPETVVRTETVPETDLSETEREVLKELAEWDLMGSTPLDAMQLIHRLQQRLKSIRV
jgi:DNA mismatch repair protein MutS